MRNGFAEPLIAYWARLKSTVHPDDEPLCSQAPAELNFDFPPPAFIGDVSNAGIFILMGNGGYSPSTPNEFADLEAADRFRCRLAKPAPAEPQWTAPYYLSLGIVSAWLRSGRAAVVNALAYRSTEITKGVVAFAEVTPSVKFNKRWFVEHLSPAAHSRQIRVVVHRPRLWGLVGQPRPTSNIWVLPSDHSARRCLSRKVTDWLAQD